MKKIFLLLSCFALWADPLIWTLPEVLSTPGQNGTEPKIAIDESGNFVAAWIENGVVLANTRLLNGSWGASSSISSSGVASLQLVVDPAGNATAIWNQSGIIQSTSLPFQGTWTAPVPLSSEGSSSPQLNVDPSGNVVAVWVCNGIIQTATLLFQGSWPATPDNLTLTASDSPQVAIGANGQIVVVWHSLLNEIDTIYAISKNLSGNWGTAQAISTYPSVQPQIDVDPNGNAVAAWYRYSVSNSNYSNVYVQASFLLPNGSWTAPTDLSSSGSYNPNSLVIKVKYNQIGLPLILWNNSYNGSTFKIEGSMYTLSGWMVPLIFVNFNIYAYDFDFSISQGGYAFGAYMFYSNGSTIIQTSNANTYSNFVNIGDATVVSESGFNGSPSISGTFNGTTKFAGAAWISYNGSYGSIVSSVAQGNALSPPTNLTVAQSANQFGLFAEYYNTVAWEGNTNSNGFLVFRNGVLIDSGPSNVSQYIDHNREENQPVVYGIAFLESSGNQTAISIVNFP